MSYQEMSEDLVGLLDLLEIDSAIVCGHSMGGRTAMFASLTRPGWKRGPK